MWSSVALTFAFYWLFVAAYPGSNALLGIGLAAACGLPGAFLERVDSFRRCRLVAPPLLPTEPFLAAKILRGRGWAPAVIYGPVWGGGVMPRTRT
jgi:hypothetical protein